MAEIKKIAKKPTFKNLFGILGFLVGLLICHVIVLLHLIIFLEPRDIFTIISVYLSYGIIVASLGVFVGKYLDKIIKNLIDELATQIKG